jgi:hypothetical protein
MAAVPPDNGNAPFATDCDGQPALYLAELPSAAVRYA